MIEFKRILCPVDFSETSVRALAHAAALARWYEAQLSVLHVVPTFEPVQVRGDLDGPVRIVTPLPADVVAEEMRRTLDLATLAPDAVPVVESGDPRTAIVDHAVSQHVDLIVLGTHGRRGFRRLILGSLTEAILRESPCPVLTVPPHTRPETANTVTVKRILCPIDFSPPSLQALGFALDLARQGDGRVTLFHALEWLAEEEPRESAHFNIPEFRRHMIADAQQRLRTLVAGESRTWVEIDDVVALGRAHREILRTAEASAVDLIVMGAHGRGGLGFAFSGSTTPQVVRGAHCPVLTVHGVRPT